MGEVAIWFFIFYVRHSGHIAGPFDSLELCNKVRIAAMEHGPMLSTAGQCFQVKP